jgi:hypothetical protein
MKNIFDKTGDKDITDLYKHIRVGIIQSVDTIKATVTIQWLDKSGARIEVPIPMPFCEQGWGIYAMPYKYALVLCDVRTYDMPVILSYVPPNFMGDDKAWGTFKTISSFPKHKDGSEFSNGEVILRNLIDKAKCKACKKVSSIGEWAATYAYNDENVRIKMESCPVCKAPAYEMSSSGEITKVNRIQLGILIFLQKDGKLSIQLNDGLSEADEDTFESGSLIKIEFDENSNVVIEGIQGMTVKTVTATTNITEDEIITSKNTTRTIEEDETVNSKNTTINITEDETINSKNTTRNITEDETINSKNTTRAIEEKEIVTSKESHETTDKKLIESADIKLGDTSALTIGQAQKIITIVTRLMTELAAHTHSVIALGSPTGPMVVAPPLTIPTKTEIETTKTKAS